MSATSDAPVSAEALTMPRDCTFAESDWRVLVNYWYPIARSCDVADKPVAAKLLDQRLVIYRTSRGLTVANDLCLHRGAPLSMGHLEGDELMCAYHGFRYDSAGQCVCIPAHPGAAIPPKLKLHTYPVAERLGLIWRASPASLRTFCRKFPNGITRASSRPTPCRSTWKLPPVVNSKASWMSRILRGCITRPLATAIIHSCRIIPLSAPQADCISNIKALWEIICGRTVPRANPIKAFSASLIVTCHFPRG